MLHTFELNPEFLRQIFKQVITFIAAYIQRFRYAMLTQYLRQSSKSTADEIFWSAMIQAELLIGLTIGYNNVQWK